MDIFYMQRDDDAFGVTVDFVPGQSDPVAVFSAMTELLAAFVQIDDILISSVAPGVDPTTVIEAIETGSVTAWIRNKLLKADDDALKSLDWRKQVGVYVVKAKYKIVSYLDHLEHKQTAERLKQLGDDLRTLGLSVEPLNLAPPTIDVEALVTPMNRVQDAKSRLTHGETITLKSAYERDYNVNISSKEPVLGTFELSDEAAIEHQTTSNVEMVLLIRKADLIGKSQWEFKHGNSTLRANIEDQGWLDRFHRGEEKIVPGAYMRATVAHRFSYDSKGALSESDFDVTKVHSIIPPSSDVQATLFGDDRP